MSDVLQCPYCVLRFSSQSELEQHKAIDHADVAEEAPPEAEPAPEVEAAAPSADREPERKGGWFKRLFGGS